MVSSAQQEKCYDFAISTVKGVKAFCTPFLNKANLVSFNYARIYKDQSLQAVHSEEGYAQLYLELNCSPMAPIPPSLWQNRSFYYLATFCNDRAYQNLLHESRLRFNCDNPLYIINKERNYLEVAVFSSYLRDNNVVNYYLNNINELNFFVKSFRKNVNGLFEEAKNCRIILPEIQPVIPRNQPQNGTILEKISSREMECIYFLSKGYRYKDIAKQLKISVRTVESHINHIRRKLNISTRLQLINLLPLDT